MDYLEKEPLSLSIQDFALPRYGEIPDIGLYLEQAVKYISEYLAPLQEGPITGSMISNYVKKGLVRNPVKKQYSREQISYLIFICTVKSVLSMEDIRLLLKLQQDSYAGQTAAAYNYFCAELEEVLRAVFSSGGALHPAEDGASDEKVLLRNAVIAVAHKVYLDKSLAAIRRRGAGK